MISSLVKYNTCCTNVDFLVYTWVDNLISFPKILFIYRFVFEDQIEFIKASVMDGDKVFLIAIHHKMILWVLVWNPLLKSYLSYAVWRWFVGWLSRWFYHKISIRETSGVHFKTPPLFLCFYFYNMLVFIYFGIMFLEWINLWRTACGIHGWQMVWMRDCKKMLRIKFLNMTK